MLLEFVFGQRGDQIPAQFDASLSYELQPFEFMIGPMRHPENIKEVLHQYAAIDASRCINLIGRTPILLRRIPIRINGSILLFSPDNAVISWSLAAPLRSPYFETMMMRRVEAFIEPANTTIIGSVRAALPGLKEERRQQVREKAALSAHVMRNNAEAVLTFLDVPH